MSIRQRPLIVLLSCVLLAAGGLSLLFMRGKGLVDETLSLQAGLLGGELPGPGRRSGVAQVTRNIDKMGREDIKKVRDALMADWQRLKQQGIDEYFAAADPDREALLDRDIRRLVTAGELWFATNPRSNGLPPKPGNAKQKTQKTKVTPDAQLLETYQTALLARAEKRGVSVPGWLLGPR
jgi:hypothetical protein